MGTTSAAWATPPASPPEELGRFFVARLGVKWDGLAGDYSLDELDEESVRQFARTARRRLPYLRAAEPVASIPEMLNLLAGLRREGHRSIPRNPLLAQALCYTELVERWGTGTTPMIEARRRQGLPEPEFSADGGLFQVTFTNALYTEEYLRKLELSERQVKVVLWVREKGRITNKEYQELCAVAERAASRDLADLVKGDILEQVGRTGKGTANTP